VQQAKASLQQLVEVTDFNQGGPSDVGWEKTCRLMAKVEDSIMQTMGISQGEKVLALHDADAKGQAAATLARVAAVEPSK
jgi:hypothetical protein